MTISPWEAWKINFARWLVPELGLSADRLHALRENVRQAVWMATGKLHDITATLQWVIDSDERIKNQARKIYNSSYRWPADPAEFISWMEKGLHHPAKPMKSADAAPLAATEFQNELGNQIKITIEGPASTSENLLTVAEAGQLQKTLVTAFSHLPAKHCTLEECPVGLFWCYGELCVKTEYRNNNGRIEAYIVSSGEAFWGPQPQSAENQRVALVYPIEIDITKQS